MPAEKKNKKNRSAADKATDRAVMLFLTAAVVLGLILIGEAAWFFSHIGTERDHYVSSANSILHMINRGEYVTALDDVRYARACGVTEQDEPAYALPYAVADYYEAAFFCAVYTETGRDEAARACRARMEDACARMGELQYLTAEIDAEVGLKQQ